MSDSVAVLNVMHERAQEARYAYGLAREAGLRGGAIYPALALLESSGLIESGWASDPGPDAGGGPRRRYYRMTDAGERAWRGEAGQ